MSAASSASTTVSQLLSLADVMQLEGQQQEQQVPLQLDQAQLSYLGCNESGRTAFPPPPLSHLMHLDSPWSIFIQSDANDTKQMQQKQQQQLPLQLDASSATASDLMKVDKSDTMKVLHLNYQQAIVYDALIPMPDDMQDELVETRSGNASMSTSTASTPILTSTSTSSSSRSSVAPVGAMYAFDSLASASAATTPTQQEEQLSSPSSSSSSSAAYSPTTDDESPHRSRSCGRGRSARGKGRGRGRTRSRGRGSKTCCRGSRSKVKSKITATEPRHEYEVSSHMILPSTNSPTGSIESSLSTRTRGLRASTIQKAKASISWQRSGCGLIDPSETLKHQTKPNMLSPSMQLYESPEKEKPTAAFLSSIPALAESAPLFSPPTRIVNLVQLPVSTFHARHTKRIRDDKCLEEEAHEELTKRQRLAAEIKEKEEASAVTAMPHERVCQSTIEEIPAKQTNEGSEKKIKQEQQSSIAPTSPSLLYAFNPLTAAPQFLTVAPSPPLAASLTSTQLLQPVQATSSALESRFAASESTSQSYVAKIQSSVQASAPSSSSSSIHPTIIQQQVSASLGCGSRQFGDSGSIIQMSLSSPSLELVASSDRINQGLERKMQMAVASMSIVLDPQSEFQVDDDIEMIAQPPLGVGFHAFHDPPGPDDALYAPSHTPQQALSLIHLGDNYSTHLIRHAFDRSRPSTFKPLTKVKKGRHNNNDNDNHNNTQ